MTRKKGTCGTCFGYGIIGYDQDSSRDCPDCEVKSLNELEEIRETQEAQGHTPVKYVRSLYGKLIHIIPEPTAWYTLSLCNFRPIAWAEKEYTDATCPKCLLESVPPVTL